MEIRSFLGLLVIGVTLTACQSQPQEWTAVDRAAVKTGCRTAISYSTEEAVNEFMGGDGYNVGEICGRIESRLQSAGCEPEDAADIARDALFLGPELFEDVLADC
jgi:hypothetical protein